MVENDILKQMSFLNDLPDAILTKVGALAQLETFDKDTILFRKNQDLTLVYMLVSGKVLLNTITASGNPLTLDEVSPGRTFGIACLMTESSSAFTAVCAEKCSIIIVSGKDMRQLFEQDFQMGHTLMLKVVSLFRARMERHTQQFLQFLAMHPDIKELL